MFTASMSTSQNSGGASGGDLCGAHKLIPIANTTRARQITDPQAPSLRPHPPSTRALSDNQPSGPRGTDRSLNECNLLHCNN